MWKKRRGFEAGRDLRLRKHKLQVKGYYWLVGSFASVTRLRGKYLLDYFLSCFNTESLLITHNTDESP